MISTQLIKSVMAPIGVVISSAALLGLSASAYAMPSVNGSTISWPDDDDWYQVQDPSASEWNLCNSTNDGASCSLPPGTYRVINHTTGEQSDVVVESIDAEAAASSYQQTSEMIDFSTGAALRGSGVLRRTASHLSLRLAAMDLDANSAYSVWWAVFNKPENCIVAQQCGEADLFESPGMLSPTNVPTVMISTFYAAGFVTGSDGVANVSAEIETGVLPNGLFVDQGWSEPVGFGPDSNSGVLQGNGLGAEVHVVLRTHGPSIAGSVGNQITTFTGLCDSQACANQQAVIFRSPLAQ